MSIWTGTLLPAQQLTIEAIVGMAIPNSCEKDKSRWMDEDNLRLAKTGSAHARSPSDALLKRGADSVHIHVRKMGRETASAS